MFFKLIDEFSLGRTQLLSGMRISRPIECRFKMWSFQDNHSPPKIQEMWNKIKTRDWNQLWNHPGDNHGNSGHTLRCYEVCISTLDTR